MAMVMLRVTLPSHRSLQSSSGQPSKQHPVGPYPLGSSQYLGSFSHYLLHHTQVQLNPDTGMAAQRQQPPI
ncbi:hypothetical protein FRC11_002586, partial [Ceratobasidium sp. 423]